MRILKKLVEQLPSLVRGRIPTPFELHELLKNGFAEVLGNSLLMLPLHSFAITSLVWRGGTALVDPGQVPRGRGRVVSFLNIEVRVQHNAIGSLSTYLPTVRS